MTALALTLSVISISLCIFGFLFFPWYVKRKTAAAKLLADYREEVGRLIAEIDIATDRDSQLVEERIKTLRKILEDTDRRIATYARELSRSRKGEAMYASLGRGIRMALDTRLEAGENEAEQPMLFQSDAMGDTAGNAPPETADRDSGEAVKTKTGENKENTADAAVNGEVQAPSPLPLPSSLPTAEKRIKVRIAEMLAGAMQPQEIASKLGISIAEVEFAINLLNRDSASGE